MMRGVMAERALSGVGVGAVLCYLLLPDVVIVLLVGFGVSWWWAACLAAAWSAALLLLLGTRQSRFLGRIIGTEGWDFSDYAQWTRYLVVRPLVVGLPAGVGAGLGAIVAVSPGASLAWTYGVTALGGVVGFILGGWYWLRTEASRHAK
jgi:hypothetical protein